jgi:uncharacterized protein
MAANPQQETGAPPAVKGVWTMAKTVTPFHPAQRHSGNLADNLNARFLEAAAADDLPAMRRFLAGGALINARDAQNDTAVIRAAREGRRIAVEALLECGASLDLQDRDGRTALAQAALSGHIGVVALLIRAGADITLDDKNGDKPLDIALRSGNAALVVLFEQPLKDLLARIPSADTGAQLPRLRTPACPPDPQGDTMLTWAAREGQENVVRALLQSGADVLLRNRAGQTPRAAAESAGHHLVAAMLEEAELRHAARRAAPAGEGKPPALPV